MALFTVAAGEGLPVIRQGRVVLDMEVVGLVVLENLPVVQVEDRGRLELSL